MVDYPKTSEAEGERLVEEYKRKKAVGRAEKEGIKPLQRAYVAWVAQDSRGRIRATLADKLSIVVNGDYGADHSVLRFALLDQCADEGIFVQVLSFREPIGMQLAMVSGAEEDFGHI